MNRRTFTRFVATIYTVASITFAMKHEWLIAVLFVLIGVNMSLKASIEVNLISNKHLN